MYERIVTPQIDHYNGNLVGMLRLMIVTHLRGCCSILYSIQFSCHVYYHS